ncbi:MAG: PstS family phosphate ABC transporter substrate-binding protein [Planctomycetaceae bacterium]
MRNLGVSFVWLVGLFLAAGCEIKTSRVEPTKPTDKLSGEIRIDGSSTVAPITAIIAEDFGNAHTEVEVPVGTSGTSGGFKKFVRGELDICDASRPISESEKAELEKNKIEWVEIQVAIDGLSVCVNPKNDWCKSLTVKQLKAIWEPDSKITHWNHIDPSWPDRAIKLFGADTDSGTFDYFTEAVMGKKGAIRSDYQQNTEDNLLVQGVAGDEDALGFFGYTYYSTNQDKVRSVPISKTENAADAVAPDLESIRSGRYAPLSRPLYIYVTRVAISQPHIAEFLKFYLSDQGQKLVSEAKAVQMSDEQLKVARERLNAALPSGK